MSSVCPHIRRRKRVAENPARGDESTTGRGDGENYQMGLLDICDTPYWETIAAAREVGYKLYCIRSGTK